MLPVDNSTLLTNSDTLAGRLQAHRLVMSARLTSVPHERRIRNSQELVTRDWRAYITCRDGCGKLAPCNREPSSYELMEREDTKEAALRALMIAGHEGDAAAYRALLSGLNGHLRAYYRSRLVRAGRGTEETEDLIQESLMAVHTRRNTYDPTQLLTP
jgi:hypothetical protein